MNGLSDPHLVSGAWISALPWFGVAVTLVAWCAAVRLHIALGSPVVVHPLLIAIMLIVLALQLSGISYDAYFRSAELVHLLLGPVVVLLAVPLWRQLRAIRALGAKLIPVLFAGTLTGMATSAGAALLLGAPTALVATLMPKSVTTPVAIGLAESLGGVPALTALVVILTGLTGACIGWPLLRVCGVADPRARGFAIGVGSNVVGTARVLQIDRVAGAFASLGMILNALATAGLIVVVRIGAS